ncbi:PDGLE domain-containing protein [Candidatus Woesearchaeota archaeon]|nr:PDGLE domain-containing protein [Candidatus Woesearchaeota archaeon]
MKAIYKYSLLFLIASMLIVSLLLPIASEHPDGLERVAENLGFIERAEELYTASPMPDYSAFGIEGYLGSFISEAAGMALVLGLGLGIGHLAMRKSKNAS